MWYGVQRLLGMPFVFHLVPLVLVSCAPTREIDLCSGSPPCDLHPPVRSTVAQQLRLPSHHGESGRQSQISLPHEAMTTKSVISRADSGSGCARSLATMRCQYRLGESFTPVDGIEAYPTRKWTWKSLPSAVELFAKTARTVWPPAETLTPHPLQCFGGRKGLGP